MYTDLFLSIFVHTFTLSAPANPLCCILVKIAIPLIDLVQLAKHLAVFALCFFTNLEFFYIWEKINLQPTNIRLLLKKKKKLFSPTFFVHQTILWCIERTFSKAFDLAHCLLPLKFRVKVSENNIQWKAEFLRIPCVNWIYLFCNKKRRCYIAEFKFLKA